MNQEKEIKIMGIVNITDNSYFAQSRCLGRDSLADIDRVLERTELMLQEGADIIDIGACSTGSGAKPVGVEEEWRRLKPVLSALRNTWPEVRISIDTYHACVVREVHGHWGDFIVNDISAGEDDPDMLKTVSELHLPYIAMHKRGTSLTMQNLCDYGDDITGALLKYFEGFSEKAAREGIADWILDPGFGFAKTIDQNYELLSNLDAFRKFGKPILVGVSRKSMIYRKFGITPEESLPQTQVLHLAALQKGATILRVHDVAEASRTIAIFEALQGRKPELR